MTAPRPVVRAVTYERDGERCVVCGARTLLEWNHRASSGHGGRGRKAPLVSFQHGVTACRQHNEDFEGVLQREALRCGWKVRRWVEERGLMTAVPVWYPLERSWYRLGADGTRQRVSAATAEQMMRDVYGAEYDEWKEAA